MPAPTRSGIPTTHADTNFRSRLEARYAAFFDLLGWRWTYEPLDTNGYIPDFLIHGPSPFFVEVGPCITLSDYLEKTAKPIESADELGHDVLIVGISPIGPLSHHDEHRISVGWFGEFMADGFDFAPGVWARCFVCGAFGPLHATRSFHVRPCGHHQSGSWGDDVDSGFIEAAWRRAGNDVQWQPRPERVGVILGDLRLADGTVIPEQYRRPR